MPVNKIHKDSTDDFELWNKKELSDDEGELEYQDEGGLQKLKKTVNDISGKKRRDEVRSSDDFSISIIKSNKKYFHGDLITTATASDDMVAAKKMMKKTRVLDTPMDGPSEQLVLRKLAYEGAVGEVTEWEPVVEMNRRVRTLELPQEQEKQIKMITDTPTEFQMPCQPRSKLETKVAAMLKTATITSDRKPLSVLEKKAIIAMNIEEAKEMRQRLQKERSLRSYQMAKMRRQSKIKSKKYHRLLKRGREKEDENKMEAMKQQHPQLYHEWLVKEDRRRIEERMTLKHKKGSKFMKKQQIYAKYNDQGRQAVQDMLQKGKELTDKIEDDEEEDDVDSSNDDGDDDDDDDDDVNAEASAEEASGDDEDENEEVVEDDDDDDLEMKSGFIKEDATPTLNEILDRKNTMEKMDELNVMVDESDEEDEESALKKDGEKVMMKKKKKKKGGLRSKEDVEIKPTSFFKISQEADLNSVPQLTNQHSTSQTPSNPSSQPNNNKIKVSAVTANKNRGLLMQAMEADDLVAEFLDEKVAVQERDQLKDYHQLTFDDMNQWTGPALKPFEKRKDKKNIIKAERLRRKDEGMSAVILSEVKDEAIAKHQVHRLPYRFSNIAKFEESIKKPVGKLWVKDTEYWKKIRPRVNVKMGEIVEAIDRNTIISKKDDTNQETNKKHIKGKKPLGKKRKFPKLIDNKKIKILKKE